MGCGGSKEESAGAPAAKAPVEAPQENIPHVFKNHYKFGDVLGEGAFSVVKLAINKRNGQRVAVKCIDRNGLPEDDERSLRQEVEILKSLKHPNIVGLLDFFEEEKYFYVVLEYLEGGELFDRIVKKNFYNEKEARDVVHTILNAMKYCHDRQIAHRDMKPENLLLASLEDDANVKIADFGFAIKGKPNANTLTTQCGTPGYVAPEILFSQPYDCSVDMWSIGVIIYILLGGYPPFHDDNQKQLFRKIKKAEFEFHPEYWGSVSDEAKDLITHLLQVDPKKRFSVDQALAHPWINKDGKLLAARNLDGNLSELRRYQATKKFKAAAKAIIATNRFRNALGGGGGNKMPKVDEISPGEVALNDSKDENEE